MRHHSAFSMIELLMAMALGLLVCATAFAGFQATARVLGRANRLALQNQLLAAGVSYALDDLDYWETWNPPTNPTSGLLHLSSPDLNDFRQARPFNRLPEYFDAGPGDHQFRYDVDYRPDAPKWWYRYELVRPFGLKTPAQTLDFSLFGKLHDPAPAGHLHNLLQDINRRLGHYALFEYWPPGVPIGGANNTTGAPLLLTRNLRPGGPDGGITTANPTWGTACYPVTLTSHHEGFTLYGLFANPSYVTAGHNRYMYCRDTVMPELFFHPGNIRLVPATGSGSGPAAWPDVVMQTRHYICDDGFFAVVSVRLRDNRTGETLAMNFSAPGTSLRGARITRELDP